MGNLNTRHFNYLRFFIVFIALLNSLIARAQLDPTVPVIAGPVGFNVIMIDESTVEFSWNPRLIDGSEVSFFKIRNGNQLLAETMENRWQLSGINRDISYDFSVSAVTSSGEETRRSDRVYYDLPQLSETAEDGFNAYLPPFESLQAEVIDKDSVKLSWTPGRDYWSWADPSDYQYSVTVGGSRIALVEETSYILTGLSGQGIFWVDLYAYAAEQMYSRQSSAVLVDTSKPPGTITNGYPGFNDLYNLTTEIYSSTAAEVFWDYYSSPTTTHVFIDGRIVSRLQHGKSLFLNELTPGKRTRISIAEGWPYASPEEPFRWLLSHDGPMMHAWIQTPTDTQENLGNPGPVTGLRADVYGSSVAEVFWDRSDAVHARYEIYLNGELLTQTDAVSWFIDGLPSGSNKTIGVVALGPDGSRSEERLVSFDTPQSGSPETNCNVEGLRASVYSATAAELFWDRSVAGTQYEISLDDAFLAKTDATSWYIDTFRPGSSHKLTVKVVNTHCDTAGVSVAFELPGGGNESNPDGIPSKPNDLSAEVYSSTAAELFWQRSTDDGWIVGYDIVRDEIVLAEQLDATSYYDDTLISGQNVNYSVFTIDNDGNRSPAAMIPVGIPVDQQTSLINLGNHIELISKVFDIYVGDFYTVPIDEISNFNITGRNEDGTFFGVFDCESGSFMQDLDPTSTNAGVFFTFDFNQCQVGNELYDGYISGQNGARGLNVTTKLFSVERPSPGELASYSGYIQKWNSQTAFFDQVHSFDTGGEDSVFIDIQSSEINIQLDQMNTSFAYGAQSNGLDIAWLKGSFNTRLAETNDTVLYVSTPVEFSYKLNTLTNGQIIDDVPPVGEPVSSTYRNNWVFTTGQLQMIAEDGSTLLLDADNGNEQTVAVTINNGAGIEVFEQPWSLWIDHLRFEAYPELAL